MIRDFSSVLKALSSEPGVTTGKMFSAEGLKIKQQIFAMEVEAKLGLPRPSGPNGRKSGEISGNEGKTVRGVQSEAAHASYAAGTSGRPQS
jgi:hypothetical protein